jgi:hypothetical protein
MSEPDIGWFELAVKYLRKKFGNKPAIDFKEQQKQECFCIIIVLSITNHYAIESTRE